MENNATYSHTWVDWLRPFQWQVHELAVEKGWYERERDNPELIALIHSELSECLEALRKGDETEAVMELADVMIRCLDMAEHNGWNLPRAMADKHEYNRTRPERHGGKLF